MRSGLQNIQVVPKSPNDPAFEQREGGISHTPYQLETAFYDCIRQGDVQLLDSKMAQYFQDGIVIGRLSENPLRQMQYWAVSCVTLAIRAAMAGGLEEITAYNLSDRYIQVIDSLHTAEQILDFLMAKATELTALVHRVHGRLEYSPHVRKCMAYIEKHLHEKLNVLQLAQVCGVSADYLSAIFKKETGQPLRTYIVSRKLAESKTLLENGHACGWVAYTLSFCSESYFIACFKKAYGVTPRAYTRALPIKETADL